MAFILKIRCRPISIDCVLWRYMYPLVFLHVDCEGLAWVVISNTDHLTWVSNCEALYDMYMILNHCGHPAIRCRILFKLLFSFQLK